MNTEPTYVAPEVEADPANGTVQRFWTYFDLADELYDGANDLRDALTLDDFEPWFVDDARKASTERGLPWPPYLPDAEEYALAHRAELKQP